MIHHCKTSIPEDARARRTSSAHARRVEGGVSLGVRRCLMGALAVGVMACGQDGDLLQYRISAHQPATPGLGVLVEVVASAAGNERRGLWIDVAPGTLSIDGVKQDTPCCRAMGDRKRLTDNWSGEDVMRLLLAVTPDDKEALLTLSLRRSATDCTGELDSIQVPIQVSVANGQDAGVAPTEAP